MPRFNPNTWKPVDDSSPGLRTLDPKCIVLKLDARDGKVGCPCGCGEWPDGPKSTFRMGHDARLRGKLIRAHLMAVNIRYFTGGALNEPIPPMRVAEAHDWRADLEGAVLRRDAANRTLVRSAIGTNRAIKVGRWDYTGQVAAVYPTATEDKYLIRYVDRAGNIKEVRVPASEAPLATGGE